MKLTLGLFFLSSSRERREVRGGRNLPSTSSIESRSVKTGLIKRGMQKVCACLPNAFVGHSVGRVSESGSDMGADERGQMLSDALSLTACGIRTSANTRHKVTCRGGLSVVVLDIAGSRQPLTTPSSA